VSDSGMAIGSVFFFVNCERLRWINKNLGHRHGCTVFVDFLEDFLQFSQ
jgi:hypothetical protein